MGLHDESLCFDILPIFFDQYPIIQIHRNVEKTPIGSAVSPFETPSIVKGERSEYGVRYNL